MRFWLDVPTTAPPRRIERVAPYDLEGAAPNGMSTALDTGRLAPGPHVVTAALDGVGGASTIVSATFTVR
jgi:large repetitive protein